MVERHGAVEAAKRLLVNGDIQTGLLRLLRLGRVDLTVEHAVLDPGGPSSSTTRTDSWRSGD